MGRNCKIIQPFLKSKVASLLCIFNISKPDKQFFVFQQYLIYHFTYEQLKALVDPLPLKTNPYEMMYRDFNKEEKKEQRFGCSLCPYKTEGFYKLLKDQHPEIYYYVRFLKLLGSAKNLVKEGKEYHYFLSSKIM